MKGITAGELRARLLRLHPDAPVRLRLHDIEFQLEEVQTKGGGCPECLLIAPRRVPEEDPFEYVIRLDGAVVERYGSALSDEAHRRFGYLRRECFGTNSKPTFAKEKL